jgi:hypothetical protein
MTDMDTIRVIPFCRKVDEWLIWSEKFLAKSRRYGFKGLLIGKLSILKVDEEYDEVSDIGKKMSRATELNEIAYRELILSIDVKTSNGKIAFNIVKSCKSKDYPDGKLLLLGRNSRTSMNLSLPLQWTNWISNSGNCLLRRAKTLKFGLLN